MTLTQRRFGISVLTLACGSVSRALTAIVLLCALNIADLTIAGETPETALAGSTSPGLKAVAQWRPSESGRFPLLEVYYHNETGKSIELKQPKLDGLDIQNGTNGVIWTDFYPSTKLEPGHAAALVICLGEIDEYRPHAMTVETQDGQSVACQVQPLYPPGPARPARTISAVTFNRAFDRVFVRYDIQHIAKDETPPQVMVNGKDCTKQTQVLQLPKDDLPGMLAVRLASATGPGKPIHVRLAFSDGEIAQSLVRASTGIFLDDFTVAEGNEALRRQLHLDLRPFARNIGSDPACSDAEGARVPGRTAPTILTTRREWYQKYPDQLSYDYFVFAAFSKMGDLAGFHRDLVQWALLPHWATGTAVLLLPGLELIVGLCLLVGIAKREAALIAAILLLLFLAVSVHAGSVKHPTVGCPCFKIPLPAWANATGWWMAFRNLFFLVLSGLVMMRSEGAGNKAVIRDYSGGLE